MNEATLWAIRAFVYQHLARTTRPPGLAEVASEFELRREEAASAYEELHRRHALYLQPGTHEILMANPFSGVETRFIVRAGGKTYFANCAWDILGIPAALDVDAEMEAACAQSGEPVRLQVTNRQAHGSDALAHFLKPFREWYRDLAFT